MREMVDDKKDFAVIGKNVWRVDGVRQVTGAAKFYADLKLPGMLYAKILRSPHAHAKIKSIDTSEACKLRGVKAVITAEDTPKIPFGIMPLYVDKLPLEDKKVRFYGDEVAAVAAVNEEIAESALDLIRVEYEVLPPVLDPIEAMKPEAPLIHEDKKSNILKEFHWVLGDFEKQKGESDVVVEEEYRTSQPLPLPMETYGCVINWETSGKLDVWAGEQMPFWFRTQLAKALNIPSSMVHLNHIHIGGGFGGKNCLFPTEPVAAILSKKTGRPIFIALSKEEQFRVSRTRHPYIIKIAHGAKKDGTLTFREAKIIMDKGAYADQGPGVLGDSAWGLGAVYRVPAVKYDGYVVYTNKNYGGGFRGYGLPQVAFAIESQLDTLAEKLGIDPLKLRLKNANQVGDVTVNNTSFASCGFTECLHKAAAAIGWEEAKKKKNPYHGVGIASFIDYTGSRGVFGDTDFASAIVSLSDDGTLNLICVGIEFGQGYETVMCMIAAEEMGVPVESVKIHWGDTDIAPYNIGVTYGDRSTFIQGNAVRMAVADAKKQFLDVTKEMFEAKAEDLDIKDGKVYVKSSPGEAKTLEEVLAWAYFAGRKNPKTPIIGRGVYDPDSVMRDHEKGMSPKPPSHCPTYSFEATAVEVEVDPETYEVKVVNMVQAVDCGRVLNPPMAHGQIDGGTAQGLGYAFTENLVYDGEGKLFNDSYANYKIMSSADIPPTINIFADVIDPKGPFGAKGLGEAPLITPAPAIANAVYNAIGVRIHDLPITPEKIFKALSEK